MRNKTSWQPIHSWYDEHQKEKGGYYHREVILPKLLNFLDFQPEDRVLDLGCGEGILGRKLHKEASYLGLDISPSLIKKAITKDTHKGHRYKVADLTKPLALNEKFTHALFILSLQNIFNLKKALENACDALEKGGSLTLVLNHPCFRIPKHSSWEVDALKKSQYRRMDRYLSSFKASIQAHPSKGEQSASTLSFHRPLSEYFSVLKEVGFYVEDLIEICSNKKSYGKNARMENFARSEFPLFMILHCKKSF